MRSENEVRSFYKQYVYRWGVADFQMNKSADQLLGAAFAYGRILGRSMKQIDSDLKRARRVAERKSV